MAAISKRDVRQRVATALTAALEASGWQEATDPYDQFGNGDGERLHQSFAVGLPGSKALADRQVPALGVLSDTTVGIRWGWNIAAMDQVASYDDALDAEETLIAVMTTLQRTADLHLLYVSSSVAVDDQGWCTGDLVYQAIHTLPLQ